MNYRLFKRNKIQKIIKVVQIPLHKLQKSKRFLKFPVCWIEFRCSIYQLPFNIMFLSLIIQVPHMCWECGWILYSMPKCVSMAIKSFLKSVTTLTCVRFHIFVFICDGCSIYNVVRLTVLRWQGTWMVSAIAAWARRWFLLIFQGRYIGGSGFFQGRYIGGSGFL